MDNDMEDEQSGSPEVYASLEETQEGVRALGDADMVRLNAGSRYFFKHYALSRFLEHPRELLHEAIVATLDGSWPWRKTRRSIREHLDRVMWSRASKHAKRGETRKGELAQGVPLDHPDGAPILPNPAPPLDRVALARIDLERFEAMFADDPTEQTIFRARALGIPRSEVLAATGIGKTTYETVSKRVRSPILETLNKDGEVR
ncbi:MAG: hypothetical protein GY937_00235 [bacterium]|nr:hypothetical protein [bacterium]